MNEIKSLTSQISAQDWDKLEQKAQKLQVKPETLASLILSRNLPKKSINLIPEKALKGLKKLRQNQPQIDAVEIISLSRQELEQRGIF
ncbi:MAG: hypothetical protein SAJ37_00545 [Oscillatoria sp. PMC 1068.18]|nr:hypothetical protein [Oscillatoria sp. PMC 1076.18]MEC4987210.1 hypothetical protein [Oscillatoria sp. PMC 1068.18]